MVGSAAVASHSAGLCMWGTSTLSAADSLVQRHYDKSPRAADTLPW